MKNKLLKFILLTFLLVISTAFVSFGFFDKIIDMFNNNSNEETVIETAKTEFNDEQKKVLKSIEEIFTDLKNYNVDKVFDKMKLNENDNSKQLLKKYIDNENVKYSLLKLFNSAEYKVLDVDSKDGAMYADLLIKCYDTKKILDSAVKKNFANGILSFFSKIPTSQASFNDKIDDFLNMIFDEIKTDFEYNAKNFDIKEFEYLIKFEKNENGEYIISDPYRVSNDLKNYYINFLPIK